MTRRYVGSLIADSYTCQDMASNLTPHRALSLTIHSKLCLTPEHHRSHQGNVQSFNNDWGAVKRLQPEYCGYDLFTPLGHMLCTRDTLVLRASLLLVFQSNQSDLTGSDNVVRWNFPRSLNFPLTSERFTRIGGTHYRSGHFTAVSQFPGSPNLGWHDGKKTRR